MQTSYFVEENKVEKFISSPANNYILQVDLNT